MSLSIGVDVGGTKIAGGLVDETGTMVGETRHPTPSRDVTASIEVICQVAAELLEHADQLGRGPVDGVGIGVAGFVERQRRRVTFAANLGWPETAVADLVERRVGIPTVVENDANAASWAEFCFGAGREHDDMVCVTVGTGIGGGIVAEGRLARGAHGMAAEIGHMRMVPDGRLCGCGKRGCWEQYASGNALVRTARLLAAERRDEAGTLLGLGDGTPEGVEGSHVTAAARDGDPVAVAAFAHTAGWLGRGLADLAAVLDPSVFVIGGGVVQAGDLLLGPAREALREALVGADHRPAPKVLAALLGNEAGIVGAADLARRPS